MEEITGIVSHVIFASNDNRFGVFILETEQAKISVTVNGPVPNIGEEVKIQGEWVVHPKYGRQIKAISCVAVIPTQSKDILRFLGSGRIAGVGPATAEKIVNEFGSKTLEIILKEPEKLLKIPKIGEKTAQKIHDSLSEQMELMDLTLWMDEHNLPSSLAHRIYSRFGAMSVPVLQKKPYSLIKEVDGIGFITADKIAQALGYPPDHRERIKAALYHVLSQISSNGHCCIPHYILLERALNLLQLPRETLEEVYRDMLDRNYLYVEEYRDLQLVYAKRVYQAEDGVAKTLLEIRDNARPIALADPHAGIRRWESLNEIQLAPQQFAALEAAIKYGVLVLTGGPGTGKTTIIKGIIALLSSVGLNILLAAPTGRAAKRMAETCDMPAYTIHRLLQRCIKDGDYDDEDDLENMDTLDTDVIIVDEMSMVDITLMDRLLRALPLGCRLVLVGDVDQLPAVGAGSVLKDIIRSQRITTIKLKQVFRQSQESSIITNAHKINQGLMPDLAAKHDFQFIEMDDAEKIAAKILELCQRDLAKEGYNVFDNVQILSPMHKMACGVENLNLMLQENLNPPSIAKPEVKYGQKMFRLGDKVMHIKNNYQKSVFNGDVGCISRITDEEIEVTYPDQTVSYAREELGQLVLAYAVSVHKSQGSEYPVVIIPLSTSHYIMLQRNLLYTAITRAKAKVIIIGSRKALQLAVGNNKPQKRYTLLANRLANALE